MVKKIIYRGEIYDVDKNNIYDGIIFVYRGNFNE